MKSTPNPAPPKGEELRELDYWIALNVAGWKFCPSHDNPLTNSAVPECWIHDDHEITWYKQNLPHYTEDKAAAMEVLERCSHHHGPVGLMGSEVVNFEVWDLQNPRTTATAPTLPLAICRFAKALFTA